MSDAKQGADTLEADLEAVLRARQIPLKGTEVAAAIRFEERRRAKARAGTAASGASQQEQDVFLRAHGAARVPSDPDAAMLRAALHTGTEAMLTAGQAADLIGKAKSTITRRAAARTLYAKRMDGALHLPAWQFVHGRAVPGLKRALEFLPETWGPRRLRMFMTTPEESLGGRSPVQWLLDGGDPGSVATLVDAETRE